MSSYETLDLAINAVGLLANFGALLFIAVELLQARTARLAADRSQIDENRRRKQEATLDYYNQSFGERRSLSSSLPTLSDVQGITESIQRATAGDIATSESIRSMLAYYETLATGVNIGIYDMETIDRLAGSRLTRILDSWLPYIRWARAARQNPLAYCEFEQMVAVIRQRREAVPAA